MLSETDAPIVFKEIGYVSQNSTLLASGVILIIKLVAVLLFLIGPVEYFGRRGLLMTGTLWVVSLYCGPLSRLMQCSGMGACLFILSALFATSPHAEGEARTTSAAGRAMVRSPSRMRVVAERALTGLIRFPWSTSSKFSTLFHGDHSSGYT